MESTLTRVARQRIDYCRPLQGQRSLLCYSGQAPITAAHCPLLLGYGLEIRNGCYTVGSAVVVTLELRHSRARATLFSSIGTNLRVRSK